MLKKEEKLTPSQERKKINKSLKYSIYDGAANGVDDGAGLSYISPFAIALKSSDNQIALLSSIPNLIAPISQLWSTKAIEKIKSRKQIVIFSAFMQSLMWIPIILIPFFFLKNGPVILIITFSIFAIFGSFLGPVWASWMGDLVPEKKRGRYFGNRSKIVGFVSLIVSLAAGFFLDIFPKNQVFTGFAILFIIALFGRLVSIFFLSKKYEPKFEINEKYQFSLGQFVKKMPYNNFGKFTIYLTIMMFAVYVASPFFSVYMLKQLKLNYVTYTIIQISSSVASLIGMPLWGKFADKYGNIRATKISGLLIPLVPVLWLFSSNVVYLTLIQIYSGFVWSGFNLSTANFVYDTTTKQRRTACIAYLNVLNGVGIFIGSTIGGLLATHLQIQSVGAYLGIFAISAVLRMTCSLFMLPKLKEVREVPKTSIFAIIGQTINRGFTRRVIEQPIHHHHIPIKIMTKKKLKKFK